VRILLVHGPNLNRLGDRDPDLYGTVTLDRIVQAVTERARALDAEVVPFQSNHEGHLIDWLQAEGGLAHYSVALRDALADLRKPVVEVHITGPSAREPFRHPLVTATGAAKLVKGRGLDSYIEALTFLLAGNGGAS